METATKNVLFNLQTVVDPDARATVLSFATELKRAQDSLKGFTDATVASLSNANKQVAETLHQLATTRDMVSKAGADRIARIEENLAQFIANRHQQSTRDVLDDIDARVRAEEEANRRVRNMPAPEPVSTTGGDHDAAARAVQDEIQRRAKLHEDANLRIIKSDGQVAVATVRSTGMSEAAYESLQGQLRNMRREMFATAAESTASVMQVARGIMNLGLVAEDDLEKVARGMIKIQSLFDVVSGGTRVLLGLEKVMHLYRASTQMATVAQEGFNASLLRTRVLNGTGLVGGLASAAGGLAGRVRGLFTSRAAMDAASAAAAAQAGRQAAYLGTSAGASVAAPVATQAGRFMGMSLAPTIAGRAIGGTGVFGLGALALGATAFAGYGAYDMFRQSRQNGIGGGAAPGSYSDYVGGAKYNPFSSIIAWNQRNDAIAAQKRTDKMEAKSGSFQAMNAEDAQRLEQAGSALQAALLSARDSSSQIFRNSLEGMKTDEKRSAIIARLAQTEKESSRLKAETSRIEDRFAAQKMAIETDLRASRGEEIDLLNQQIAIERELGEAKKAAAREKLQAETETLSKVEAQLKLSKDQLLSARERFALMNEGDQMAVTQLAGKLKSGGQLSAEELGRLSSFRELGGVKESFDKELERRAAAGGFDKAFGGQAQTAIDALEERTKAQREIVAALKTEINVTIDADTKKITDELNSKVGVKLKQLGDEIRTSVSKLEAEVTDIKQRLINRANQP